jgi:hypothetical protein
MEDSARVGVHRTGVPKTSVVVGHCQVILAQTLPEAELQHETPQYDFILERFLHSMSDIVFNRHLAGQ